MKHDEVACGVEHDAHGKTVFEDLPAEVKEDLEKEAEDLDFEALLREALRRCRRL